MPNRNLTNTTRLKSRELLRRLRPRFPALFPTTLEDLKPWAVGQGYRLRQALAEDGEQVSNQVWRVAINLWVHGNLERRVAYLKCLTEGAPRYDLHGNVSGKVSAEEAAHADAELPDRERQLAELRSARRPQAKARGAPKPSRRTSLPDTAGNAGLRSFSPHDRVASAGEAGRLHAAATCPGPQRPPPKPCPSSACDPGNGLSRHGANTRCSPSAATTGLFRKCVYRPNHTPPADVRQGQTTRQGRLPGRLRHPGSPEPVPADAGESVCRTRAPSPIGVKRHAKNSIYIRRKPSCHETRLQDPARRARCRHVHKRLHAAHHAHHDV